MIYLEYAFERMKTLLKTRPRLQGNVFLPLGVRCNATTEDIADLVIRLKNEYEAFQSYDDDSVMRGFVYLGDPRRNGRNEAQKLLEE